MSTETNNDHDIVKVLELSTCHVSLETSQAMNADTIDWPMDNVDYGWLVYCRFADAEDLKRLPKDLAAAIRMGHERGCKFLKFDCDASIIDGLTEYLW